MGLVFRRGMPPFDGDLESDDPPEAVPHFEVIVQPDFVVDPPAADGMAVVVQRPRLISKGRASAFLRHFRDVAKSRDEGIPLPITPAEFGGVGHEELVRLCEASVVFISMATMDPMLNLDEEMQLRYRAMVRVMGRWILCLSGHADEVEDDARVQNLVSSIIARSAEIVQM